VTPLRSLRQDMSTAAVIASGSLTRATPPNPAGKGDGVTDFVVGKVLKSAQGVRLEKTVTINRYIPDAAKGKVEFVIFFDLFKNNLDPYRGIAVQANSDLPKYLEGILKIKDQKPPQRLRYYFDFLENADPEVANDALTEFRAADYADIRAAAPRFPPAKLVAWLKDPKTPPHRLGLYAFLLAHCSKDRDADAALVRGPVEKRANSSYLDQLYTAQVLFQPKPGWQAALAVLRDPKQDFMVRYAALRTTRFFFELRPDVVPRQEVVDGVALLLPQADIADLAIEDLRKWKCWELTPRILALANSKEHDVPIMKRALVRFALCSPAGMAKEFIDEQRKRDPQRVRDVEDMLKQEAAPAAPAAPPRILPPTPR
jgi:hypothetical protein